MLRLCYFFFATLLLPSLAQASGPSPARFVLSSFALVVLGIIVALTVVSGGLWLLWRHSEQSTSRRQLPRPN